MSVCNKTNELISIIVPVYNTPIEYLDECLDSLKNQTYKNIEIILVDDGSNNQIANYLDCISDKNIIVLHKENGGVSSARNYGVKKSNGKLICFVDADDCVNKLFVEVLHTDIIEKQVKVAACNLKKTKNPTESENQVNVSSSNKFFGKDIWQKVNTGYCVTKMYDRAIFHSHLFNENISMCEDTLFINDVLNDVKECSSRSDSLYYYRDNPNGSSRLAKSSKYLQAIDVCKKIRDLDVIKNDEISMKTYMENEAFWQFKYMLALSNENSKRNKAIIKEAKHNYSKHLLPFISKTSDKRIQFVNRMIILPDFLFLKVLKVGNRYMG